MSKNNGTLHTVNFGLNVTPEDNLNSLRAANSVASALTPILKQPIRAVEMQIIADEKDHRFDYFEFKLGLWIPFAYAECKARTYYSPPLVSCNKVDEIWNCSQRDGLEALMVFWFDAWPKIIYWRWLTQEYFDQAQNQTRLFGHGKREYREPGYPFPIAEMEYNKCEALGERLASKNSTR